MEAAVSPCKGPLREPNRTFYPEVSLQACMEEGTRGSRQGLRVPKPPRSGDEASLPTRVFVVLEQVSPSVFVLAVVNKTLTFDSEDL